MSKALMSWLMIIALEAGSVSTKAIFCPGFFATFIFQVFVSCEIHVVVTQQFHWKLKCYLHVATNTFLHKILP